MRSLVGVVVVAVVGCGVAEPDGYEPGLKYPGRTDAVILRPPADQPAGLPPPGKLEAFLAESCGRGAECASPASLSAGEQCRLANAVNDLFGTPVNPRVPDVPAAGGFDLSPEHLAAGSRVYKRLCANCHGLTGDGRGPVGPWTYPYPRDFRAGAFKVGIGDAKPTPEQLARLLRQGVPGSSMPVFDLLADADIAAVSAYVVHLSVRGEAEIAGVRAGADGDEVEAAVKRGAVVAVDSWSRPPVVVPEVGSPASDEAEVVRRGMALFHSPAAGCASCHQDYGRAEAFRYDRWGAPVRVHDLTRGEFRWGRDEATIAARIRHGIPAAGMPANSSLTAGQLADLTAFVRDVGSPGRLPADVRAAVYPQAVSR